MKKSYIFLAEGFEEMEALAVVDILRRGGVEIETVSIMESLDVVGSHGIKVVADRLLSDVADKDAECMIFPGGLPGAENLGSCKLLLQMTQKQYDNGKFIAAICAAPALVLKHLKVLGMHRVTCYPGFESHLIQYEHVADGVVVDRNLITGKGPGFALPFGLAILSVLRSRNVAEQVASGMLLQ